LYGEVLKAVYAVHKIQRVDSKGTIKAWSFTDYGSELNNKMCTFNMSLVLQNKTTGYTLKKIGEAVS